MASNSLPVPGSSITNNTANSHESTPLLPSTALDDHGHRDASNRVAHQGESGRSGFHPYPFLTMLWRSSCTASMLVNLLWPFAPVAMVLHFLPGLHLCKFVTAYIAVIPSANLLGFAGQEFARKMPKVLGILIKTMFGSIIEIILFVLLISKHEPDAARGNGAEGNLIPIIQAAILGSILTNLLLCLGLCFFFGGLRRASQKFHAIVSEVGTSLLLFAAFGLLIPSAFYSALREEAFPDLPGLRIRHEKFTERRLQDDVLRISQATSIALIVAFFLYIWYQASSQHSIFDEVIEMDEHRGADRQADMEKPKFTMTETLLAIAMSLALVTLLLVFLVDKIEHVVESGVPDRFLGLILLPLVEKAAEHLTAIDEAWADGVINVVLYHCLGPSIQTALFNGPLVVLVGWAMGKPMDLNFDIFMICLLLLSTLVVRKFLRDGESNWLEGALLVIVYVIIANASWYYPNLRVAISNGLQRGQDLRMIDVSMTVDTFRQLQQLNKGLGRQ
ncbi:Ca2+:H+ antiporter [Tolypocladium paradoxum]|uniref:Ca2+:H+ antiporter n=1 Tax=Tolypocladium paradoxum TaxID=94208 RepID=A0A2S4KLI5_9HYPO|nr:Ca2+:H+ antiporter [Tolypocladium paradoxum]